MALKPKGLINKIEKKLIVIHSIINPNELLKITFKNRKLNLYIYISEYFLISYIRENKLYRINSSLKVWL